MTRCRYRQFIVSASEAKMEAKIGAKRGLARVTFVFGTKVREYRP